MTKVRDLSASRVARSAIFLILAFFISWLAQNDELSKIVHPRMNPWIEGAGVLFLILSFAQLLRVSERPRRPDPLSFFIPIAYVLAIVFIFVRSPAFSSGQFDSGTDSLAVQSAIISKRDQAATRASMGPLPATIAFDDDRYWSLYNRLYDDPAAAVGHRVVIQGFLRRASQFPPGTALIARNLMWCCSADMAQIGLIVSDSAVDGLKESQWVEASGRLEKTEFDMNGQGKKNLIPVVVVDSLKPVDKGATSGIIFPY